MNVVKLKVLYNSGTSADTYIRCVCLIGDCREKSDADVFVDIQRSVLVDIYV